MHSGSDIYRQEALDQHAATEIGGQSLLMIPRWAHWTYRLLLVVALAAGTFAAFAVLPEYAEGPAVIRALRRHEVTTAVAGLVDSVHVSPGHRVGVGDVLLRLRSSDQRAEVISLEYEFSAALIRLLADPQDEAARQALGRLRGQNALVTARLEERTLRAATAGTVGDIRVRPGQSVSPGDLVMSIGLDGAEFLVLALLPGNRRPELRPGQQLTLELSGYENASRTLQVERIEEQIVGPLEVRRMLGPTISEAMPLNGALVAVHARLPGTSFEVGGDTYNYFDGMQATARVQVRSARVLARLLPGGNSLALQRQ